MSCSSTGSVSFDIYSRKIRFGTVKARTVGALGLRPTGNALGSNYFISLKSGLLLNRTYPTKLPMPDEVIDRVHALARRQRAQLGLLFGDRLQHAAPLPIDLNVADDDDEDDEDDYDSSFYPDDDEDNDEDISVGFHHDGALPLQHDRIPGVDQNNENESIILTMMMTQVMIITMTTTKLTLKKTRKTVKMTNNGTISMM
jgi:hypothetical protein